MVIFSTILPINRGGWLGLILLKALPFQPDIQANMLFEREFFKKDTPRFKTALIRITTHKSFINGKDNNFEIKPE